MQVLEGKNVNNKSLKIANVLPRTFDKNGAKNPAAKLKSAREAVTPLADLSYADQLEQKKASISQMLKKLVRNFLILSFISSAIAFSSLMIFFVGNVFYWQTRNARKACPNGKSLPEWVLQSREIGNNTILLISILIWIRLLIHTLNHFRWSFM